MQDSSEWVGRTVGTKKYRPPEMRDGRAATSAIDVYCFGLMVEKLLRQVHIDLTIYTTICLYIYLSICLSIHLSIHLSIYRSIDVYCSGFTQKLLR